MVQRQIAALRVDLSLLGRCTNDALWTGDKFPGMDEGPEQYPQIFKEESDESFHVFEWVVQSFSDGAIVAHTMGAMRALGNAVR